MATDELAAEASAAPVGYSVPLRIREFRGLVSAQVLSELGDQVARVALASLILVRSGSVFLMAATFAVSFLPAVLGSALLGSLADRLPRKAILLSCDLIRAVLIGAIALLATDEAPLVLLLGLLFVAELFSAPFLAAQQALLPDVLPEPRDYLAGAGLVRVLSQFDQVLGLVFAGLVVHLLSVRTALVLDAISFAVSFLVLLATLRRRPAAVLDASPGVRGYLRDLGHGARITAADPVRRVLVMLGWGAAFVLIAPEAVALAYARDRGLSELAGSLLMATVPAGAALGAYLIGRIDPVRAVQLLLTLVALACLPLIATLADPPVLLAGLLWLISGTCQGFMVPLVTTVNLATPREQRGMVNGLAAAGFNVSTTAAFLVVGALSDLTSPAIAVGAAGIFGLVVVAASRSVWPRRAVRRAARMSYADPR